MDFDFYNGSFLDQLQSEFKNLLITINYIFVFQIFLVSVLILIWFRVMVILEILFQHRYVYKFASILLGVSIPLIIVSIIVSTVYPLDAIVRMLSLLVFSMLTCYLIILYFIRDKYTVDIIYKLPHIFIIAVYGILQFGYQIVRAINSDNLDNNIIFKLAWGSWLILGYFSVVLLFKSIPYFIKNIHRAYYRDTYVSIIGIYGMFWFVKVYYNLDQPFLVSMDMFILIIGLVIYLQLHKIYDYLNGLIISKSLLRPDKPLNNFHDIDVIQNITVLRNRKKPFILFEDTLKSIDQLIQNKKNYLSTNNIVCICIDGVWGAGKSSIVNIQKSKILQLQESRGLFESEKYIWIDFDPWHFSNCSELIQDLFNSLDSEISSRYGTMLTSDFRRYLKLITPIFETNMLNLNFDVKNWPENKPLKEIKEDIKNKLINVDELIIISIDDLDRMEPKSILMVLKLVKLVFDFPNIMFILPFDYNRVSKLIVREYGNEYSNYLQKIINHRIKVHKMGYSDLFAIFTYHMNSFLYNSGLNSLDLDNNKILEEVWNSYLLSMWLKYCEQKNEYFAEKYKDRSNDSFELNGLSYDAFLATFSLLKKNKKAAYYMSLNEFRDYLLNYHFKEKKPLPNNEWKLYVSKTESMIVNEMNITPRDVVELVNAIVLGMNKTIVIKSEDSKQIVRQMKKIVEELVKNKNLI